MLAMPSMILCSLFPAVDPSILMCGSVMISTMIMLEWAQNCRITHSQSMKMNIEISIVQVNQVLGISDVFQFVILARQLPILQWDMSELRFFPRSYLSSALRNVSVGIVRKGWRKSHKRLSTNHIVFTQRSGLLVCWCLLHSLRWSPWKSVPESSHSLLLSHLESQFEFWLLFWAWWTTLEVWDLCCYVSSVIDGSMYPAAKVLGVADTTQLRCSTCKPHISWYNLRSRLKTIQSKPSVWKIIRSCSHIQVLNIPFDSSIHRLSHSTHRTCPSAYIEELFEGISFDIWLNLYYWRPRPLRLLTLHSLDYHNCIKPISFLHWGIRSYSSNSRISSVPRVLFPVFKSTVRRSRSLVR